MIETHQLCLKYAEHTVLDNINLTFRENGITSIIGANGAGKSSLLSIVSRLAKPSSGKVSFKSENLHTMNSALLAKKIAVLRQENSLSMRLTVQDLVCFGRFPYHAGRPSSDDYEQVNLAIETLHLNDFKQRYINELSGGQRQRAFIAMVLAQQTDYILLDEPLNNLDMKQSINIMKTLQTIASELHKSVIIVLHDINYASCYSDEIIAMKQGKVLYQDSPDHIMQSGILQEIYDTPLHTQTIGDKKICLHYW